MCPLCSEQYCMKPQRKLYVSGEDGNLPATGPSLKQDERLFCALATILLSVPLFLAFRIGSF